MPRSYSPEYLPSARRIAAGSAVGSTLSFALTKDSTFHSSLNFLLVFCISKRYYFKTHNCVCQILAKYKVNKPYTKRLVFGITYQIKHQAIK